MIHNNSWCPGGAHSEEECVFVARDYDDWGRKLRAQVALMRELGVVQAFGIMLGPEPRVPTKLEAVAKRAEAPDATAEEKRAARIEEAREAMRAKLGNWDITDARIDPLLDPSVFE